MRSNFDLTPFTRSTVGFDRMFRMLDSLNGTGEAPGYPPYNIVKTGEDEYRISVAVAGFGNDELDVETRDGRLTIKSLPAKAEEDNGEKVTYLHRGIARRAFELTFSLADHIEVTGADLDNGLLNVALVRNVPEAMKPRSIPIGKTTRSKSLTGSKAA